MSILLRQLMCHASLSQVLTQNSAKIIGELALCQNVAPDPASVHWTWRALQSVRFGTLYPAKTGAGSTGLASLAGCPGVIGAVTPPQSKSPNAPSSSTWRFSPYIDLSRKDIEGS